MSQRREWTESERDFWMMPVYLAGGAIVVAILTLIAREYLGRTVAGAVPIVAVALWWLAIMLPPELWRRRGR